jgi:DNA/RNA endonuclease YhcR with UshA esterase domain
MLTRQEQTAVLLLVIVAATILAAHLLLAPAGREIAARPYTGDAVAGDLVVLEGTIEKVRSTRTGGHTVLVVRGVAVFVPADAAGNRSFTVGELLRVVGTVQYYQGEEEIAVEEYGDIRVLS